MEMTATAADEGRQARSAPVVCSTSDTALGNADVITLCKINADLAAETSGLRVRNELGDGLLAHSPCDADDGRNHELVHGACGEAADEVAVDLEVVRDPKPGPKSSRANRQPRPCKFRMAKAFASCRGAWTITKRSGWMRAVWPTRRPAS